MNRILPLIFLLACLLALPAPSRAESPLVGSIPVETREIGLLLYDREEVPDPRNWLGTWHFPKLFSRLQLRYEQAAFQEYRPGVRPRLVVCFFVDPEVDDFFLLRDLLLELHRCGTRIYFVGSMGACRCRGKWLNYREYNQILNTAGLEDRSGWTHHIEGMQVSIRSEFFNPVFREEQIKARLQDFRMIEPFVAGSIPLVEARLSGRRYVPVSLTPWGGAILSPYLTMPDDTGDWKLALDLEAYFRTGLSLPWPPGEHPKHPLPAPLPLPPTASAPAGEEIPRRLTLLYDGGRTPLRVEPFQLNLSRWCQLQGLRIDPVDISGNWDPAAHINDPLLAVSLPTPQLPDCVRTLKFLRESQAKKIILAGYLPIFDMTGNSPHWGEVLKTMAHFQLIDGSFARLSERVSLQGDPRYYPAEMPLRNPELNYLRIRCQATDAVALLTVTDSKGSWTPVFRSGRILAILGDLLPRSPEEKDAFHFGPMLADFLDQPAWLPPARGHGARIAISHIDGDGFHNTRSPDFHIIGAERIYEVLLSTNFPVSASFIVQEILPHHQGRLYALDLARRIIALPHVEPAAHSFTHPFAWDGGGDETVNAAGYPLGTVDDTREILMAARSLDLHLPEPCHLFFWSGDCRPLERQLRLARASGLLTINGGDSIAGGDYPLQRISPLGVPIGREFQTYAGAANENLYTHLWTGPFDGYRHAVETFARTDEYCPVTPVDVYYHFFSGAVIEGRDAVRTVYDWVRRQEYCPLFTSEYLELIQDWLGARLTRDGDRIRLNNTGHLRSLFVRRRAPWQGPDLDRSRGILGFAPTKEGWEFFLDAGTEHEIVMRDSPGPLPPHIRRASHRAECFPVPGGIAYRFTGFGPFRLEMGGTDITRTHRLTVPDPNHAGFTIARTDQGFLVRGELRGHRELRLEPEQ